MLDQPVPNPVAKNPNIYTHKVFAAIGLILIGTIVAVAGIWWYMTHNSSSATVKTGTIVKVTTTSAKPATSSAAKDETDDWKTYTNKSIGFTIKYPPTWLISSSDSDNNCTPEQAFFAQTKDLLGICASGFAGIIGITRTTETSIAAAESSFTSDDFNNLKKESVTVTGLKATKITGTIKRDVVANPYGSGTKQITYLIDHSGLIHIDYRQVPNWPDSSKEFEQMVSSLKFN